jgi:asparagine synthase (glutamine-hydrolysing)
MVWVDAINKAAQQRKLNVLLTGQLGNFTISYNGNELLAELWRTGRLGQLARESWALVRQKKMRLRGVLARILNQHIPPALWRWVNQTIQKRALDPLAYTSIQPVLLSEMERSAGASHSDPFYRRWNDAFALRLWGLQRIDLGCHYKGMLGGWGIDHRDPTGDRRLIEFCLSVPTEQFLKDGVFRDLARRALADRLPADVLDATGKGLQAADWHEGLVQAREQAADEIERLEGCEPAARILDIARLRKLTQDMPAAGWETAEVVASYRTALLRGISIGHFLRRASGSNA